MQIHINKVKKKSSLFWAFRVFVHQVCYVIFRWSTDVLCKPTFEGVSFAKWRWYRIWELHSSGTLHKVEWSKNSWPLQMEPIAPKRRSGITTLCYILSQKSTDLIYLAAEAWIHAWYIICSGRNVAFFFLCHKCLKTQGVFSAGSWNL